MSGHLTEIERKQNQVFVRNLSFETTSDDLLTLFQDIGPVKRASVAEQDGKSKGKFLDIRMFSYNWIIIFALGYGFVKFALEDDAERAVTKMQSSLFKGRKMLLELAVKKGTNPDIIPKSTHQNIDIKNKKNNFDTKHEENIEQQRDQLDTSAFSSTIAIPTLKRSLQLFVFGVPYDVNKKGFLKVIKKISRKAGVTLLKEVRDL